MVYYKKADAPKWTRLKTLDSKKTSYTHTSSKKYPIIAGQKYTYTVRGYNKISKKYGQYDKTGISVNVPSAPTNKSGIAQAYKGVLKAVAAGKSGYDFPEVPGGARDLEYFLYDMDKDGIKELIVGSECTVEKTLLVKLCHVYTCQKTNKGYTAKKISGYVLAPQTPATGSGLYENYYLRGLSLAWYKLSDYSALNKL